MIINHIEKHSEVNATKNNIFQRKLYNIKYVQALIYSE